MHIAQNYSPNVRVNALAPGFFETEQNKFLLRTESGELTARAAAGCVDHTPAGRWRAGGHAGLAGLAAVAGVGNRDRHRRPGGRRPRVAFSGV
ncbi:MAG: hypothetical protein U1F77_09895 [Kiritimatiellia bacterium]